MTQLVRDKKHPGQKKGNDVQCETPPEALHAMGPHPQLKGMIFPFTSDTVSRRFTVACKFLDIEDLHFQHLRHEAVSQMFEMGRTIPQTAAVLGHRSWQSMLRYAQLRKTGDEYKDWIGWERLARP